MLVDQNSFTWIRWYLLRHSMANIQVEYLVFIRYTKKSKYMPGNILSITVHWCVIFLFFLNKWNFTNEEQKKNLCSLPTLKNTTNNTSISLYYIGEQILKNKFNVCLYRSRRTLPCYSISQINVFYKLIEFRHSDFMALRGLCVLMCL